MPRFLRVVALLAIVAPMALMVPAAPAMADAHPVLGLVRDHIGDDKPFIILATIELSDEVDDAARAELAAYCAANELAANRDDGPLYFEFLYEPQDVHRLQPLNPASDAAPSAVVDASRMILLEHWARLADLEQHFESNSTQANVAALEAVGAEMTLRLFRPLSGNAGANLFGKPDLTKEPATSHREKVRTTIGEHWDYAKPLTVLTEFPVTGSADADADARAELADVAAVTEANAERLDRFVVAVDALDDTRVLVWEQWPDLLAYFANADTPRDTRLHQVINRYGSGRRMTRVYVDPFVD